MDSKNPGRVRTPGQNRSGLAANVTQTAAAGLAVGLAWLPRAAWKPALRAYFGLGRVLRRRSRRWRRRLTRKWLATLPALRTHRPGGWRIAVRLTGREHIDAALADGHGAILWVSLDGDVPNITSKMALARAGYRVSHLSRPNHGFGGSPFQERFLNRLVTSAESRYLAERIVIQPGSPFAAMRTLRGRLAANRVVSIMSFSGEARREIEVSVDGKAHRFPTGPVTLAAQSGAPLLPVFCIERRRGRFEVVIEAPLTVATTRAVADLRPYEEFARLIAQHRARRRRSGR